MATGSQARFSVFNGWSALPAAMPTSASFFFESETARLTFVQHRWPQGFRWWLFCQFPREDTAAHYERRHDYPEAPKLHVLHCRHSHSGSYAERPGDVIGRDRAAQRCLGVYLGIGSANSMRTGETFSRSSAFL
jgi:hypothetical protein